MYIQHAYRQPAGPRHSIRESTTQDRQPLSTKFIRLEGDALTISKETFFSYSVTVLRLLLQLQSHCTKVSQRHTCRTGVSYGSVDLGLIIYIPGPAFSSPTFPVPAFPRLHFWSRIFQSCISGPSNLASLVPHLPVLHFQRPPTIKVKCYTTSNQLYDSP